MLEIFAIPYLGVTGLIGWLIFAPFFRLHQSEPLSRSRVAISDLFAMSLPVGILLSLAKWMTPVSNLSLLTQVIGIIATLAFAATTLTVGLFLIPKTFEVTFLKRIAVVGIIAPFGILLTVAWIGILTWACIYSVMYLAPAMIAVAAITFGLRMLTLWVCEAEAAFLQRRHILEE
jgi:hypothetical protein